MKSLSFYSLTLDTPKREDEPDSKIYPSRRERREEYLRSGELLEGPSSEPPGPLSCGRFKIGRRQGLARPPVALLGDRVAALSERLLSTGSKEGLPKPVR